MVRPQDLGADQLAAARAGTLDADAVRRGPGRGRCSRTGDDLVDGLLAEAHDHAVRRELEDSQRAVVAGLGVPVHELPRLAGGIDLGGLYELAADLKEGGLG